MVKSACSFLLDGRARRAPTLTVKICVRNFSDDDDDDDDEIPVSALQVATNGKIRPKIVHDHSFLTSIPTTELCLNRSSFLGDIMQKRQKHICVKLTSFSLITITRSEQKEAYPRNVLSVYPCVSNPVTHQTPDATYNSVGILDRGVYRGNDAFCVLGNVGGS